MFRHLKCCMRLRFRDLKARVTQMITSLPKRCQRQKKTKLVEKLTRNQNRSLDLQNQVRRTVRVPFETISQEKTYDHKPAFYSLLLIVLAQKSLVQWGTAENMFWFMFHFRNCKSGEKYGALVMDQIRMSLILEFFVCLFINHSLFAYISSAVNRDIKPDLDEICVTFVSFLIWVVILKHASRKWYLNHLAT